MRLFIRPTGRTLSEPSPGTGLGVQALLLGIGLGIVAKEVYPELSQSLKKAMPEGDRMKSLLRAGMAEKPEQVRQEGRMEESGWAPGLSERRQAAEKAAPGIFMAESSIAVDRPPADVYQFWKDFNNFPRVMSHIDSVNIIGPWRPGERHARFSSGGLLWDVEIVNDIPYELISWRSVEGCPVKTEGEVAMESRRGWHDTIVSISVLYQPPLGSRGVEFAEKFGQNPSSEMARALRNMKNILESEGRA